jgi:hypothetical protein
MSATNRLIIDAQVLATKLADAQGRLRKDHAIILAGALREAEKAGLMEGVNQHERFVNDVLGEAMQQYQDDPAGLVTWLREFVGKD